MERIHGVYIFGVMKAKRRLRTYKAADVHYNAAKEKADKTKKPLSTRIEEFVIKYSEVEKTSYFASMGNSLIQESNKKKK